ncbi:class IIb bacteriocin, lactobin A/cerein 7B family [Listeria booriae]|uniref:class IIb bacteriocin, lactobin A/cerein 7B family n=1 Tax=Listeria booriae TaxID=1552123 RepID=UPI0016273405|nr:class IIb bacteriocin, lactobin A/cerein 7B family [Listeria booriae]MBC2187741.1 class IIb bacteriocin, lactobin A/cerein 7B family [Listeria booriae]
MENIGLEKFKSLNEVELQEVEGGLFPIVVVITGKAVAAAVVGLAGLGAGIYFGTR